MVKLIPIGEPLEVSSADDNLLPHYLVAHGPKPVKVPAAVRFLFRDVSIQSAVKLSGQLERLNASISELKEGAAAPTEVRKALRTLHTQQRKVLEDIGVQQIVRFVCLREIEEKRVPEEHRVLGEVFLRDQQKIGQALWVREVKGEMAISISDTLAFGYVQLSRLTPIADSLSAP